MIKEIALKHLPEYYDLKIKQLLRVLDESVSYSQKLWYGEQLKSIIEEKKIVEEIHLKVCDNNE